MQVRPLDRDATPGTPPPAVPDLDVAGAPHLTLVESPSRRDRLPEDWTMVGPVLVAGRTLDRVVVGPNGVFAVSHQNGIKKISYRLGIGHAGAAGNNYRKGKVSFGGEKRNTGQIQHGEHIGVIQLVEKAEADDVKSNKRPAAFQGLQRNAG